MLMIELAPLDNGAHRNQNGPEVPLPEGWAKVPPELEAEAMSFLPFIELEVEDGQIVGVAQGTVPPPEPPSPEEQIAELKANLDATDYQAIKYAEGWITAEDYAPIKAQRQAWRDRINELEGTEDA